MISPPERELLGRIAGLFDRYEVDAYVVGGSVRDWLLERTNQDLDLAMDGDALSLTRALADELNAAYVPLDEEHATARVVLRQPSGPVRYVDVARLRRDTLPADLADRDFTVNAMAIPLMDAAAGRLNVIDPLDGQADLRARRLRATSASAFHEDPLRLLRGVRLAAELDLTLELRTRQWIAENAEMITTPAPERLRDELVRLFACPGTAPYLRLMDDVRLLAPLFPELDACRAVTQPAMHRWDVLEHLLEAVDRLEDVYTVLGLAPAGEFAPGERRPGPLNDELNACLAPFAGKLRAHLRTDLVGGRSRSVLLKILVLLHDVGKPQTRSEDEAGDVHFYQHEQVGAGVVAAVLGRLHFGSREVKIGRTVTLHHMRPKWLAASEKVTSRAVYRFYRDTGESGVDVVLLSLSDTLAKGDVPADDAQWVALLDITRRLLEAWFERRSTAVSPPALVRGSELIEALELEPGPLVGDLLEAIREAQVADEVSSREEALTFAHERLMSDDVG